MRASRRIAVTRQHENGRLPGGPHRPSAWANTSMPASRRPGRKRSKCFSTRYARPDRRSPTTRQKPRPSPPASDTWRPTPCRSRSGWRATRSAGHDARRAAIACPHRRRKYFAHHAVPLFPEHAPGQRAVVAGPLRKSGKRRLQFGEAQDDLELFQRPVHPQPERKNITRQAFCREVAVYRGQIFAVSFLPTEADRLLVVRRSKLRGIFEVRVPFRPTRPAKSDRRPCATRADGSAPRPACSCRRRSPQEASRQALGKEHGGDTRLSIRRGMAVPGGTERL